MTDVLLTLAGLLAWGLAGVTGLVWGWTYRWDLTTHDLDLLLPAALSGPLAWAVSVGWRLAWSRSGYRPTYTNPNGYRVLIRCRRR